jgi:pimeloyl-ACP methyl ester carboxylesterase
MSTDHQQESFSAPLGPFFEYMTDVAQRSILFCDVMRQRSSQYREHLAETVPHVLDYEAELVMDGRMLERPVNYLLVRIVPPAGVEIDLTRRPFVVVDPRAGHGPGIGGFKADSEIGVTIKAGHTCYFIGFLPEPMPGQTIEDVALAEAQFLEKVISLHPQADGKPCVIGNCQAGWAVMILAAIRPELFGPIIVAGAPLSYWAGVRGQNPMRYSGGLLGGSWLTALTSDVGGGKFDGGWLVQNFENQNPANTLWTKQYNLYSKVDTEAARYLEFERWWGGHVNLNAEEMQFIVDELFVGNNLAVGRIEPRTARPSIFAIFARRLSCSVPRATTSRRRNRRSTGYWIFTTKSTKSGPLARPSCTPCTRALDISGFLSQAGWRRRSTMNSPATSI